MKTKDGPKLPVQQLVILSICRFAEPVALTSVFPYLPEMIESFNIPENQVAKWAGVTSAVFSLAQCLTGIPWGRASDRFGRKPVILTGLSCTMVACILFGFSRTLIWAILARAMAGFSNGNVGIIRTTVAELVPERELQPRAFSVMPLVWTIGSIFGPAFGGALANPAARYPHLFGENKFFKAYPFALPNLVACIFFTMGLSTGFLFLRETLEVKKHKRDIGIRLGQLLTGGCTKQRRNAAAWESRHEDSAPLLRGGEDPPEGSSTVKSPSSKYAPPGWKEVFSPQSNINLLVYTMLAMHSVAFDQLLPIFMHHPTQDIHSPDVKLPLKFSGGFGIDSGRIGILFTLYGIFGMFIQFFIFPPIARKFGILNCLKVVSIFFPCIYVLTPFSSLLPTILGKEIAMFSLMLVKSWAVIFAFPCSTILLTNSASSLRILGTLNGVATSISAIGRAAGPAIGGSTFSMGVDAGYVIVPWWTLAFIAALGAIPVFYLIEMDGFGPSSSSTPSSLNSTPLASTDSTPAPSPPSSPSSPIFRGLTKSFTAPIKPSRPYSQSPHSGSSAIHTVTEEPDSSPFDDEEDFAIDDESSPALRKVVSPRTQGQPPPLKRRMSTPIGLVDPGVRFGRARRYSSNLGITRAGYGSGGGSFVE